MSSLINQVPTAIGPVICDFGWYYGVSPTRLPEYTYTIGTSSYPPGKTTLGTTVTLPSATVASSFTALATLKANFPTQGAFVLNNGTAHRTVNYTGLGTLSGTAISGVQGFTGCTGGTGTFTSTTPLWDPRYYVDSMPRNQIITFDAIDHQSLGLPMITVPSGTSIINYQWDFGNGSVGYGPFASTTYTYPQPSSSIQATLTVTDSLGRTFSCAHRLNQV